MKLHNNKENFFVKIYNLKHFLTYNYNYKFCYLLYVLKYVYIERAEWKYIFVFYIKIYWNIRNYVLSFMLNNFLHHCYILSLKFEHNIIISYLFHIRIQSQFIFQIVVIVAQNTSNILK